MKRTAYVLGAVMAAFGGLVAFRPQVSYGVDEAWLEKTYPQHLDQFSMIPSSDGGAHTYKMDTTTYQALLPYGIVGRVLSDGKQAFDVVVISGDHPDTFHNPLACFRSQDWNVVENREVSLETKTRGPIKATLAKAIKGGEPYYALYTFEGPSGYEASNSDLHKDLFVSQFKSGRVLPATFFRFMTQTSNIDDKQLIAFAEKYIDASPVRPILSHAYNPKV